MAHPIAEPKNHENYHETCRIPDAAALRLVTVRRPDDAFTSKARLKAIDIEVVPQVSGYVAALAVTNAQLVEAGDLLARIDQRTFVLEVEKARSALQSATQALGASSSQVEFAQANLTQAEIGLKNTEIQSKRTFDSP